MHEPILLLDEDEDDQLLFVSVINELAPQRPVHCFSSVETALDYLRTTPQRPFLIVSEMRLPGTDGIEFRQLIEQDKQLRQKAIPFIYLTGTVHEELVERAYELTIQGLFEKSHSRGQWLSQFSAIIQYWETCVLPQRTRPAV